MKKNLAKPQLNQVGFFFSLILLYGVCSVLPHIEFCPFPQIYSFYLNFVFEFKVILNVLLTFSRNRSQFGQWWKWRQRLEWFGGWSAKRYFCFWNSSTTNLKVYWVLVFWRLFCGVICTFLLAVVVLEGKVSGELMRAIPMRAHCSSKLESPQFLYFFQCCKCFLKHKSCFCMASVTAVVLMRVFFIADRARDRGEEERERRAPKKKRPASPKRRSGPQAKRRR